MKLGAYIPIHNEEDLIVGCIDCILPYIDELLVVFHGSTDSSMDKVAKIGSPKIKLMELPYTTPVDMGAIRTKCYQSMESEWVLAVDADEYYSPESMQKIRSFVNNPGEAISARVKYHNLAWRAGYKQFAFEHYPDRLYKREVIDRCEGVLPLDMQFVKKGYLTAPNKKSGSIGVLEYDREDDRSHEHPRQPILDAWYYHLARTRGYNFEYEKNLKYQRFMHPEWTPEQCEQTTRNNQWVAGDYQMEQIQAPNYIPTINIPRPKVSVVVTCYNKAPYIAECIESLLNQTHKPHEVIVIDDGSQDNSREVINSLPVKYVYQANAGVSHARNKGLDMVTGDYFILIDGDDKLKPNYIERCLEEMKGDVQIVTTDFEGLGEWEGMIHNYPHPFNREQLKTAQTFPSVMALCDRHLISRWGNFRHDLLSEDYAWWLELVFRRNANVVHIPEPLCYYRRTTGSRVDQVDLRRDEANLQLMNEFKEFGVAPVQYKG